MAATEQDEVPQRGRPTLGPMTHVMALTDPHVAPREAAGHVPTPHGTPQRGRNRTRPRANFDRSTVVIVAHHHPTGVARQAPGRFRGNVAALFQHGLAGLRRFRQHRGVHMDYDLVPLTRRAGIEFAIECRLREQGQRVSLLLCTGRGLGRGFGARRSACPLIQRFPGRVECPLEQGAYFRGQPPTHHHRAVLVPIEMEAPCPVLPVRPRAPRPADPLAANRGRSAPRARQSPRAQLPASGPRSPG